MQSGRRGTEPVFVDRTGRRRRLFVMAGTAGAAVLVLAALALLAGFTGVGPRYLPRLPVSDGQSASGTASAPGGSATRPASPRPLPAAAEPGAAPSSTRTAASAAARATPTGSTTAGTTAKPSRRSVPTQTPTSHPTRRN